MEDLDQKDNIPEGEAKFETLEKEALSEKKKLELKILPDHLKYTPYESSKFEYPYESKSEYPNESNGVYLFKCLKDFIFSFFKDLIGELLRIL